MQRRASETTGSTIPARLLAVVLCTALASGAVQMLQRPGRAVAGPIPNTSTPTDTPTDTSTPTATDTPTDTSTPDRGSERTVSHGSANGTAGPVVAGVSTAPRLDIARPMSRTSSRPPRF